MYAIVDIAGQQFKVEKDKKVYIHRIKGDVGTKVDLNKVLFIDNEKEIKIGTPYLKDASVTGKIVSHVKDKKVKIFKKKRRKGYKVFTGHRQYLTELLIEDISERKAPKEATAVKETEEKTTKKKEISETRASSDKKAPEKTAGTRPAEKKVTGKEETEKQKAAKPVTEKKSKAGTKAGSQVKKKPVKKQTGSKSITDKKPAGKTNSRVSRPPKGK